MKTFCKQILCITLILCSLPFICMAGDMETISQPSPLDNANAQSSTDLSPMASVIAMDQSITRSNFSWYQQEGYPSYRVWVENTTNYIMTVRITSPKGLTTTFLVPAGGSNKCVSNTAVEGGYDISFSTTGNVLGGTVRVRVSTVPQT